MVLNCDLSVSSRDLPQNVAAVFVVVAASFTFPDPASAAASFDQSRDISSLPYLGQFEFGQHDVKGHVYQVSLTQRTD